MNPVGFSAAFLPLRERETRETARGTAGCRGSEKEYDMMKTALTIAGTDPSGGAGIQADIKTMTANGVFALSAVTALVAPNTTGVKSIQACTISGSVFIDI